MAFSDWTPFNGSDVTMTQTSLNPLADSGSLRMECAGVSSANTAVILPEVAGALPHGFNMGRIESLFRIQSNNGTGTKYFGLVANISDEGDPKGSANAYGMVAEVTIAGSFNTIKLIKWSGGGGISSSFSVLQSITIGTPVDVNDTFAFQFDWISDVDVFGGTKLTCRFQEASNFTSIPTIIDYVDALSPLITSESEGLYISADNNASALVVNADTTSVYEIT